MLRTEDERLTNLLGGLKVAGGVEAPNTGAVEPEVEKAKEPFDCETVAEPGRGLEGRLESREENVERRFSQVD